MCARGHKSFEPPPLDENPGSAPEKSLQILFHYSDYYYTLQHIHISKNIRKSARLHACTQYSHFNTFFQTKITFKIYVRLYTTLTEVDLNQQWLSVYYFCQFFLLLILTFFFNSGKRHSEIGFHNFFRKQL